MTNQSAYKKSTGQVFLLFLTPLLLALLSSPLSALAVRVERNVDTWRPTHYLVNVTLNDQLTEIASASTRIEIVAVKTTSVIDLDFGDMKIDAVTLNSRPTLFDHRNGKLEVRLPESVNAGTRLSIVVDYHGKPKDGLILTTDKDGKPSAVGDNWPNRVHHWIPSLDHPSAKATVTFNITAAARDEVVANGKLEHVETSSNGSRTWTFSERVPIPPYCMIIGVGQFARLEPTQPALTPLAFYVAQSDVPYAQKGFASATPALQFFNDTVAAYPYEKLALIIGATKFGGMENSSAIVFTNTLFNQTTSTKISKSFGVPSSTVMLVAHEIAHQWFGDSVTESTWADLWLSEGFATYFAGLFIQRSEGEEAFQAYMKQAAETAFAYEKKNRTPIFDRDTEDLFKLLNANNYEKGAWVLHMLRSRLGDETFFRGIRNYYLKHKDSNATTEDLRDALEKASGKNLQMFFMRWVYDSGHPKYELSWDWKKKRGDLRLALKQLQTGNAFLDPLQIKIVTANGTRDVTVVPIGKDTSEVIKMKEKVMRIEIDPGNTLLKEVSLRN
jgi:aminopeptidase N